MTDQTTLQRLTLAYVIAAETHSGQRRKGSDVTPYINHPAEVARLVSEHGTPDEVIAAVLHDTVEDGDVTLGDIRRDFGETVADIVEALTNPPDWEGLSRAEMKDRQAEHMADATLPVKRVKIADQTSNVRDFFRNPGAWDEAAAREYIDGAERVVDACRGTDALLEHLFDHAVAEARKANGLTAPRSGENA
ncbi:HD domain-containing protein [Tropicimonas sp. IMCC34011]|uniref:HD domain-containing protein n=1 Tax=Tropicimonas sp. IMCC34011 TaxID=2248759 RepID=UPI000E23BF56|nr:HD domain-containing protein [Tropicimonas sp. IMCC34011]